MATKKGSEYVYSAALRSSSLQTNTSATNESSLIVMPYFADPNAAASYPNTELPVYASSSQLQPSLARTHTGTGTPTPNSALLGAATESGADLYTSQNSPCISEELNCSSVHSCPRSYDGCCFASSKRSGNYATPLQIPVVAVDNEFGSMEVLQSGYTSFNEHRSRAQEPIEKLHAPLASSREESPQEDARKLDVEGPAGEVDQEVEEEGCTTPTARDQRIPQYGWEVSALRCPPAPKKKAGILKRRRLFYSASMAVAACAAGQYTASNVNSRLMGGERGALCVDPPADLHNFPECIRALFK